MQDGNIEKSFAVAVAVVVVGGAGAGGCCRRVAVEAAGVVLVDVAAAVVAAGRLLLAVIIVGIALANIRERAGGGKVVPEYNSGCGKTGVRFTVAPLCC